MNAFTVLRYASLPFLSAVRFLEESNLFCLNENIFFMKKNIFLEIIQQKKIHIA